MIFHQKTSESTSKRRIANTRIQTTRKGRSTYCYFFFWWVGFFIFLSFSILFLFLLFSLSFFFKFNLFLYFPLFFSLFCVWCDEGGRLFVCRLGEEPGWRLCKKLSSDCLQVALLLLLHHGNYSSLFFQLLLLPTAIRIFKEFS